LTKAKPNQSQKFACPTATYCKAGHVPCNPTRILLYPYARVPVFQRHNYVPAICIAPTTHNTIAIKGHNNWSTRQRNGKQQQWTTTFMVIELGIP